MWTRVVVDDQDIIEVRGQPVPWRMGRLGWSRIDWLKKKLVTWFFINWLVGVSCFFSFIACAKTSESDLWCLSLIIWIHLVVLCMKAI
jgi:hypothetical protein